jgi:energy-converting hydrogenase B subunit Q
MNVHAVLVTVADQPGMLFGLTRVLADHQANITYVDMHSSAQQSDVYFEFTLGDRPADAVIEDLQEVAGVIRLEETPSLAKIYGKRIIVMGGGAQVGQVAMGAISEADRHNIRGERISVDTIPLVGEPAIAAAVRAVADLPRARLLVRAGSIMGGDISTAADELRAVGIPIIALNMVGSITEHVDLVVSDPVQAGTMAVMAVADTATFDLERQRGRRY